MATNLLWHSNAPWATTGYGNQTALFAPLIAEHYELVLSSFYGLDGAPRSWKGIPVLPGLTGEFGGTWLPAHAKRAFGMERDGMVVTLMDVWVLPNTLGTKLNLVSWTPVDHDPVPPGVLTFFGTDAIPMAMSRFGEQQLGKLDPLYSPHGVDTETFKPCDKEAARKEYGVPDGAFLVGMVAANKGRPSRKCFVQTFQAFKMFLDRHDDAYLYVHSTPSPDFAQGEDLFAILESLKIPADRVFFPDPYRIMFMPYPAEEMAQVYSTFDVLINISMGEGFGIPVLEAQACGVPGIVSNFSAMPEVCGSGAHVKCRPFWTGQGSWMVLPDVEDTAEALHTFYCMPEAERKAYSRKARQHALKYDVKRVFEEHMLPSLQEAERRFEERQPVELELVA